MSYTQADYHADLHAYEEERWFRDPISNDRFRFEVVQLSQLQESSLNPREPRQPHIDELVASIEHHGQLVPGCAVELESGHFELLGGNHRRLALEIVFAGMADKPFQVKVLHPETTTARRLQVSSELNASVKPLNFGEKCRHMLKVRLATEDIWKKKHGTPPTERQLATELGATAGEHKMIFLMAPAIAKIREDGSIKAWVDDHQHPIKLVRQRHDQQIITVKNLAYFLWPFFRQELVDELLPIKAREAETLAAIELTNFLVQEVLEPLWNQQATETHQAAVDFVRHHPFRALASCWTGNQDVFSNRKWALWGGVKESTMNSLKREIKKARTIDWGDPQIRDERSLAKLATTIAGQLYRARVGGGDAG